MRAYLAKRKYFWAKAINAAVIVALIVAFTSWAAEAYAHDAEVEAQITAAERAASRGMYPTDGVFEGSAQGFGGPVTMRVTIDNGYIDQVEIADASMEDAPWLEMCLGLPDAIVKAQGTGIDVVSGATFTSSGILNGTTEALRQSLESAAGASGEAGDS